ncbi:MAG: hypothetical protein IJ861_01970 [Clostridia bacterium]|nr:hypothetical protein [Clostridia bacterium]
MNEPDGTGILYIERFKEVQVMREIDENTEPTEKVKTKEGIIPKLLSSDRALSIIVITGLIGIGLIFISSSLSPPSVSDAQPDESELTSDELLDYRTQISEELGNMLASMDGVGRTKVMVTISGTVRNVYATDVDVNDRQTSRKSGSDENADNQNTERRSCIVIRQKDGSEKALTIGQLMPEIKGVLIICDGGDNEQVRDNIVRAVAAALDINDSHICVSKLGT